MSSGKRIHNNTDGIIHLPPTDTFLDGVRLLPRSLTTITEVYWTELMETEIDNEKPTGKKNPNFTKTRCPGKIAVDQLLESVSYVTRDGTRVGPRITIFDPEQCADRDDGPELPDSLDGMKDEIALKVIEVVNNKAKLKLWTKDRRREVASRASARLAQLG